MTPIDRMILVYEQEKCARTFYEDLHLHLINGFVFSRPDFFIMGRPVIHTASIEQIVDPGYHFPSADCDCWHVYGMAGNLARAWETMPWPLPLMSFERRNELHILRTESLRRYIL